MPLQKIDPLEFVSKSIHLWEKQWLLLTSGNFKENHFNTMTVAWGSMGVMWHKPFVQVVVRPTRYTFEFMEKYNDFTLTAFSETHRKALQILGTQSGRDGDKIKEAGLTPVSSQSVGSPVFEEAMLSVECRKIYWQDMAPGQFLDSKIQKNYPKKDYHRIYFGEIVNILGDESFS